MNRSIRLVSAAVTLAVAASAQCFTPGGTSVPMPGSDDDLSAETPLGITFPMAGGSLGNYTHCVISTNGVLYLTDGTGALGASATNYGSVAQLQGAAGDSPRIAPYWDDLWAAPSGWDITIESTASSCTVRWLNVLEWNNSSGTPKSFSVTLNDSGIVDIAYEQFTNAGAVLAGVSGANAVADPGSTDLSASPAGSTELVYENFATASTFDLSNSTLTFIPNGVGYDVVTSCTGIPALNTPIGSPCFGTSDSFYQEFADASVASPALTGNVLQLTPTVDGYLAEWQTGTAAATYITPAGTPIGTITDDGQDTYTPATGFPSPYGPVTDLRVHGNAIVAFGTSTILFPGTNAFTPTGEGMFAGATGGVYAWHDYNVVEGGDIIGEEQAGQVLVTYLDIESYSSPAAANPSTLQFQFDQATGVIRVVFLDIDDDATSTFGSGHLVGYSAPGAGTIDPGSIDLAAALPLAVGPEVTLELSASGTPISTPSSGSVVGFTLSNIPDANVNSGVFIGAFALSVDGAPAGIDLGVIGAPGCNSYVNTIGIVLTDAGQYGSSMQTTTFSVPAGVPAGLLFYTSGASLVFPGSLPGGQNAAGIVTSNGIESQVGVF